MVLGRDLQKSRPFFALIVEALLVHHCTLRLTVAVLLAMFGSGVSDIVAAFAVIVAPVAAVTFTVRRTVHVVLGAMPLPS